MNAPDKLVDLNDPDAQDALEALIAYHNEVQFAGWTDSHIQGAKITFWLADSEALEYFRCLTTKKGGKAGQRFMLTLVELDDDDSPINQVQAQRAQSSETKHIADRVKGGELSKHAGRLCNDEAFFGFLSANGITPENAGLGMEWPEVAANYIRKVCQIGSRAELDHSAAAAQRYHSLIRQQFIAWVAE